MVNAKLQKRLISAILKNDFKTYSELAESPDIDLNHRYSRVAVKRHGIDIIYDDVTPLYLAQSLNNEQLVEDLVVRGADPQARVSQGHQTPAHEAIRSQQFTTFLKMLPYIRDPDLELFDGVTLLDEVLILPEIEIPVLSALLRAGASPNHFNATFEPPLFRCVEGQSAEAASQLLLDAGADIQLKNSQGQSLLQTVSPVLKVFYQNHIRSLQNKLTHSREFGIPVSLEKPQENVELLQVAGAGLLPEMFALERWRGAENEALDLYDRVKKALPEYYKNKLETEVDLTPLRRQMRITPQSASAVERLSAVDGSLRTGERNPW